MNAEHLISLLSHASIVLVVACLVLSGLGAPFPEDLVLLAAGVIAHRGGAMLPLVIGACMVGVLVGDFLLFTTARRLGPAALDKPLFRRLLPPERREKIARTMEKRGPVMVFVARHIAGMRAPVFALAGIHQMPLRRFLLWDALGACISVPLMIGLGYVFSDHIDRVLHGVARVEHWVGASAAVLLTVYVIVVIVRRRRTRERTA